MIQLQILQTGNASSQKSKRFECENCGCIWLADKDEYEIDWSRYSLPAYCACPCCKTEIYAIGTFKSDKIIKSHRKDGGNQ